MKRAFSMFAFILLVSGMSFLAVQADTPEESYKKGDAAMRDKNYEAADREFRRAAEQGHLSAQLRLALMYTGYDDGEAMKWWRKAADQGSSGAMLALADLYKEGGTEENLRDYAEAMKWYRKAADSASMEHRADALYAIGEMVEYGWGVISSLPEALKWYGQAAELGHSDAKKRTGP
jgi:uncharacterized protein